MLLRALDTHGTTVLPQLNSIFAFAFLDLRAGQLLLARDHFGVKPLYYAEDAERFYFGSEVKSILAAGFRADFKPHSALDFTFTGWTADERTLLRGVRCLLPGSLLRYDLHLKKIAIDYLPRCVVYRPKMGFSVPPAYFLGEWPEPWLREGFAREAFGLDRGQLQAWIAQQTDQSVGWMLTLEI